jgi:hypothetical protein
MSSPYHRIRRRCSAIVSTVRWLKFILLVAGGLGAIGFVLPFLHDRDRSISALDAIGRVEDDWTLCDARLTRGVNLPPAECNNAIVLGEDYPRGPAPRHCSYVPFYFIACAVMLVLAAIAIVKRRLGGLLALLVLPAALAAIGGPLRELRVQHHLGWGAALLAIAGMLALAVSIIGAVWTEAVQPRRFAVQVPAARVVRPPR